jgi:hypothetical protein
LKILLILGYCEPTFTVSPNWNEASDEENVLLEHECIFIRYDDGTSCNNLLIAIKTTPAIVDCILEIEDSSNRVLQSGIL